jgi:hypothetical protein
MRFLVLLRASGPVYPSISGFLRSITMFASFACVVFFIALLIDCPTDVTETPVGDGLSLSHRLDETRDPHDLRGVCAIFGVCVRPALRLTP